jgi:hypothetical protein
MRRHILQHGVLDKRADFLGERGAFPCREHPKARTKDHAPHSGEPAHFARLPVPAARKRRVFSCEAVPDMTDHRADRPYRLITSDDPCKTLGQGEVRYFASMSAAANAFERAEEPYKPRISCVGGPRPAAAGYRFSSKALERLELDQRECAVGARVDFGLPSDHTSPRRLLDCRAALLGHALDEHLSRFTDQLLVPVVDKRSLECREHVLHNDR